MFKAIYDRHNVPVNHRAALTRYLNRPNGVPASLRHYFIDKRWAAFIRECMVALTDRFINRLRNSNANA